MDIDIRFFHKKDYPTIWGWWRKHDSFAPLEEHLPPTGLVAHKDKEGIAAGFLYKTDSSICVFEFAVCNPEASKEDRDIGLDLIIKKAIEWSKTNNYTLIYTSISIQKYINRLKDNGFIEVDKNQTHMFKGIENE